VLMLGFSEKVLFSTMKYYYSPNMIVGLCVDAHFMRFSLSGVRRQYFAGGNPV